MRSFSPPRIGEPRLPRTRLALVLLSCLQLSSYIESSRAFSFSFSDKPTQCASTDVTVDGGTPPYRIVMVPSGPLSSGPEIRTIVDQEFSSTTFTLPPLNFPGGSNFTAVMSDSTGTGTGGTSVITDVGESSNTSCLASSPTSPRFFFQLPQNPTLTQCGSIEIGFSGSQQGQVTLMGLIPGGTSFSIDVPNGASSTTWNPIRVPAGTGVMLVAGDERGRGTGGSSWIMIVQGGDEGCLHEDGRQVYSSTNEPYAGGQYATGSGGGTVTGPWNNGSGSNGGSGGTSGSKVGMIVGIVVGVLALLVLILLVLFYRRRKARKTKRYSDKEVDLLNTDRPSPVSAADQRSQGLEPIPYYASGGYNPYQNQNQNGNGSGNGSSGHRPSTSIGGTDVHSIASHDPLFPAPPSAWNNNWNRPHTPSSTTGYDGGTDITSNMGDRPTSPTQPSSRPTSAGVGAVGAGAGAGRQDTKAAAADASNRMRTINIVQHSDAGAVPEAANITTPPEAEVVELPPSYNEVRRHQGSPHVSP